MVIIDQYVGVPSLYLIYLTHQGDLFFRGKKAVDHHQAHHTRPVITNMMMEVWMQVLVAAGMVTRKFNANTGAVLNLPGVVEWLTFQNYQQNWEDHMIDEGCWWVCVCARSILPSDFSLWVHVDPQT